MAAQPTESPDQQALLEGGAATAGGGLNRARNGRRVALALAAVTLGLVGFAGLAWLHAGTGAGSSVLPAGAGQAQTEVVALVEEGGDAEGGDAEGGDAEGGDAEGGDAEGGDAEGGDKCTPAWGGCKETKTCCDPAQHCYLKNEHWAQCRHSCEEGLHPEEQNTPHYTEWSCEWHDVHNQTECSAAWKPCWHTKKCCDPNQRCFTKNPHWAQCRTMCKPGMTDSHDDHKWQCEKIDKTEPTDCAKDETVNCRESRCCKKEGHKCWAKDAGWAICGEECPDNTTMWCELL
eukprot:CAMPEP_0179116352 /NCGR_PEP_ID=MMETSP0796-20121207/54566_1 /TAXON_ID=73915 /ORGANISM="Pyrodinium bahamense, Strain pbaha01" /LENGTH=288 /DNA_ID=CAMNT_0020814621 /DNA_START=60 /DNA_END=926 /DNA_ORIENTATION=-